MNAGYQAHTAEEDLSKGSQQDEPRAHAEVLEGAVLERAAQEAAQDRVPAPEHAAEKPLRVPALLQNPLKDPAMNAVNAVNVLDLVKLLESKSKCLRSALACRPL